MSDAALPVLYTFRRCPYAMRARLALAVSNQAFEPREVVLRSKPAALLAASPKGTVPVLVLADGQIIDQSLDVMLWALQRQDPTGWLAPTGCSFEAMASLIAENDGPFKHALDRYKYPTRYLAESDIDDPAFARVHRTLCAAWVQELESMLGNGWLFGERASLADMALLPFVRQFAHTDAQWFAEQAWPRLQAWLAGFEASAIYAKVMEKRLPWVPQAAHAI